MQVLEEVLDDERYPKKLLPHALQLSITTKQPAMVERLLKAGAYPHAFDDWCPMLLTAMEVNVPQILDIMIKYCRGYDVWTKYGNMMHKAVRLGDIQLVKKA